MASPRMAPMRGVTYQFGRLSMRQDAAPRSIPTSFARSISTSTSPQASVSTITTSADGYVPLTPFEQQKVQATIHRFPTLEPLRLESFPANHLYLPTRRDILHRAVVYEGDKTRLGTASAKTRYEVRGSARKIRPQKGSGRARLGDRKSPMLVGGGVAHGPRPRDFSTGLQKKVYDLAFRTALSYRFRRGELFIVDNAIEIEAPSTRLLRHIFDLHDHERGRGRSLLVTLEERPLLRRTLEKMDRGKQAQTWEDVDVKDLLSLSRIIIERSALHNIIASHQEDLSHARPRPIITSSPPTNFDSVVGWSEFRDIMTAPLEERDAIRSDAYESVAATWDAQAETLPEGTEKTKLLIAAYELWAEAKDLRRAQLPAYIPLQARAEEKSDEADMLDANRRTTETYIARKEAADLVVQVADLQHQHALLSAEAVEYRSRPARWRGDEKKAGEMDTEAEDLRSDAESTELQLWTAKREAAEAQVQVLVDSGDYGGAHVAKKEALDAATEELRVLAAMGDAAEARTQKRIDEEDLAGADVEQKKADALRSDVATKEPQLWAAKRDAAQDRAQFLIDRGDLAGADVAQTEAEAAQEMVQQLERQDEEEAAEGEGEGNVEGAAREADTKTAEKAEERR